MSPNGLPKCSPMTVQLEHLRIQVLDVRGRGQLLGMILFSCGKTLGVASLGERRRKDDLAHGCTVPCFKV